jgi:dihydroxy-acid dehydratase
MITIDIDRRRLEVELDASTLAARLADWRTPTPRYASGVFARYAQSVASAADGAVMRS